MVLKLTWQQKKPHKSNITFNNMNNKWTRGGVFCDMEKVFGCVKHDILLSKIEFHAIIGI